MYGLLLALLSAFLFGASTPASKVLLGSLQPFQLAGLLYLAAAIGMAPVVALERRRGTRVALGRTNAAQRRASPPRARLDSVALIEGGADLLGRYG